MRTRPRCPRVGATQCSGGSTGASCSAGERRPSSPHRRLGRTRSAWSLRGRPISPTAPSSPSSGFRPGRRSAPPRRRWRRAAIWSASGACLGPPARAGPAVASKRPGWMGCGRSGRARSRTDCRSSGFNSAPGRRPSISSPRVRPDPGPGALRGLWRGPFAPECSRRSAPSHGFPTARSPSRRSCCSSPAVGERINKVVALEFAAGSREPAHAIKFARVREAEPGLEREAEVLAHLTESRPRPRRLSPLQGGDPGAAGCSVWPRARSRVSR